MGTVHQLKPKEKPTALDKVGNMVNRLLDNGVNYEEVIEHLEDLIEDVWRFNQDGKLDKDDEELLDAYELVRDQLCGY